MSDAETSALRMIGVLVALRHYMEDGVFNHEGLEEMRLLGRDLSEVMPDLVEHVRARGPIPEAWLRSDLAPWRGERFEEEPVS